jgi:DNA mismatch repair ATPase MutS
VLENPLLEPDPILQRQQAVRWLAEHHDERARLMAALAGLRGLDRQMPIFEEAVDSAKPVLPTAASWLLRAWSLGVFILALYAAGRVLEGDYGPAIWLSLLVTVNVLLWLPLWSRVRQALLRYQRSFEFAREYDSVAKQAAADLPNQTQLNTLRGVFDGIRQPGSLPAALQWIAWSAEGGVIQVLLDLLIFSDLHMVEGIQRHVGPHREPMLAGLGALAELEALLSLGCFAAEQPTVCWPEPRNPMHLSIRGGIHPLIDPAVTVPNDVDLATQPNVWIITGSNMSGKSTFLRMIGVNVLLAQTAGVALAAEMTFSPLRLVSDLRIRDNLNKGESYFLAEVRHLRRMIVPPAGDVPMLGLVDEPFRGTNHREQRAATLAIIEHLVRAKGMFLVATHDSTVTRLADGACAQNQHFQERLGEKELVFDYQLRPGPAVTRNAIRVLQREQYPADLIERALRHADDQQADEPN